MAARSAASQPQSREMSSRPPDQEVFTATDATDSLDIDEGDDNGLWEGFSGQILTTPASAEIAPIVLHDAARILEEDAAFKKKRHQNSVLMIVMATGMAWTGTYNLELFFSLWVLWIIVAVLLLSPRNVRPRHLPLLTLVVVLGQQTNKQDPTMAAQNHGVLLVKWFLPDNGLFA